MVLCFKCSAKLKEKLDRLVGSGEYKSYEAIISSAVTNLVLMQEAVDRDGFVVIGSTNDAGQSDSEIPKETGASKTDGSLQAEFRIPEIFLLSGKPDSVPRLAEVPNDARPDPLSIQLEDWIFGQMNKLLPAKTSCRALANLMRQNPRGVHIDTAVREIGGPAAELGAYLRDQDALHGRKRDDAFALAFPSDLRGADKSRLRFVNQFVACASKNADLHGLLYDLKLIQPADEEPLVLLLTEAGWRFAMMPNPVLDDPSGDANSRLTNDEQELLVRHIRESVPRESSAYFAVIHGILEAHSTPDRLDEFLSKTRLDKSRERKAKRSFISTQRSGAVSRMEDLGLVRRDRKGTRMFYTVTDRGQFFKEQIS